MALINILIALALLGGESMDGYAPRYSPGLMERVSQHRGLEPVPCMVSSPYYGLGTWVYVWSQNKKILRHCRVTDVSAPQDAPRHKRTRRIVELSYELAAELCGQEYLHSRPEQCPVTVIRVNEGVCGEHSISDWHDFSRERRGLGQRGGGN